MSAQLLTSSNMERDIVESYRINEPPPPSAFEQDTG